ncbi:MAG: LysM peptidoglycan-binding domain-containing protein [Bacteroidetes bacterium]|nr:LysM peptidoglycan-binding domain-containing protein [Bacteroidota bacterium]
MKLQLKIFLVTLLLAIPFRAHLQSTGKISVAEYIDQYNQLAMQEMKRVGIPASITLAQGILESGFGNSELTKVAKNHFGIKCHNMWTGPKYFMDDDERNECFRKYTSANQSFIDHSNFLAQGRRYAFLFELEITDYKGWANGLKKAGYATNPKYPELLTQLISEHELYVFAIKSVDEYVADPFIAVFEHNRIRTIITGNNDTPLKIANRYQIRLNRILKYNDLEQDAPLKTKQRFYLQPKRRVTYQKLHYVEQGETMYSISQRFGVKLKLLLKRNLIKSGAEPLEGEKIYLNRRRKDAIKLEPVAMSGQPGAIIIYIVATGDSLFSIANKFHTTVDKIKADNNLHSNAINPGDSLRISK